MTDIQRRLFALRDEGFRAFHCRLIPTVPPETVIGVRMPALRRLGKTLAGTPQAEEFLRALPHKYYEENNLHAYLIAQCPDFALALTRTEEFLPYVDNWATCDMPAPKVFAAHRDELLPHIRRWMASGQTYTVRYGIGLLMQFFLDEAFRPEYLDAVAAVRSEEYYVNMMIAWYFATALAKQYAAALPVLQARRLDGWTHNKTIQKAVESYRITPEQKTYLKTLRVR